MLAPTTSGTMHVSLPSFPDVELVSPKIERLWVWVHLRRAFPSRPLTSLV